jgi:hypothetical protein
LAFNRNIRILCFNGGLPSAAKRNSALPLFDPPSRRFPAEEA